MQRLAAKFRTAATLVPQPVPRAAASKTRFGVIYFGSTSPAMDEALHSLAAQDLHVDALRLRAFPFPASVLQFIEAHDEVFVVEQNEAGQLRMLLINECEIDPKRLVKVLHYDGTPITAGFIAGKIAEAVKQDNVTPLRKQVAS